MSDPVEGAVLRELLEQIAAGEASALAALYERTVDRLNALVQRIVRIEADADDVLSEVYRQVWERPRQYTAERGPVLAWLYVIARTRSIDLVRRRRVLVDIEVTPLGAMDASVVSERVEAPELLAALQAGTALHAALRDLSAEQRQMLELSFFRGLSHLEISEQTGLALGTVKSHIRRGQQAMRKALEARGISDAG